MCPTNRLVMLAAQRYRFYDVGALIERQINLQQNAKLEKQMYKTLTVRPNIVNPMFKQHLRWATIILQTPFSS